MLHWKFCVDWQPNRCAIVVARQSNREFDSFVSVVASLHVFRELFRRQHLFEQNAELPFAPTAASLYVRQHALEAADITRELLHRAEALGHLLKSIAHQLEGLAATFLEGALQFF